MKSDEEESSLKNNSEFGLDQIGSNLSKMDQNGSSAKDPIIALLSEYCHSKVLNIDYLLGKSSQPFTNKAAKTTSLKRKRSENKSYENQKTHLKNINNPQPSSSTSLTVSDASSSAVSSPSLPKSGSVSPRPESIIGKYV